MIILGGFEFICGYDLNIWIRDVLSNGIYFLVKLYFVEVFIEFGFELIFLWCIMIYVKVIVCNGKFNFVVDCSGYLDFVYFRRVKDELYRRGVS